MSVSDIWEHWRHKNSHCSDCPGRKAKYPLFFGSENADVMIVGIEPAYNLSRSHEGWSEMDWGTAEDKFRNDRNKEGEEQGNPLWNRVIEPVKEVTDSYYFTNISKCNPAEKRCTSYCHPYITQEIACVDPEVILLFGEEPTQIVFSKRDISWNGLISNTVGHLDVKMVPPT